MKKIIYTSDIQNLVKSFIQGKVEIHLFDPEELVVEDQELDNFRRDKFPRVLVNVAPGALEYVVFDTFDYVIDFAGLYDDDLGDFKKQKYKFINNGDGTMRYLFPKDLVTPDFISVSNQASFSEKLKTGMEKYLLGIRFFRWMISGEMSIYHKHALLEPTIARDFGDPTKVEVIEEKQQKINTAKEKTFMTSMSLSLW